MRVALWTGRGRLLWLLAIGLVAALAGCGSSQTATTATRRVGSAGSGATATVPPPAAPVAHPQAIEPVAGAGASAAGTGAGGGAGAVASPAGPASVSVGPPASQTNLPQPAPLSEIRRQLAQSGLTANPRQAALTAGGLAVAPVNAPLAVQEVIAAGNEIARLPYRYGGGHATYEDTAYDCSGSISFVFAAAGLLDHTVDSGQLESWGAPGPGRWITIFANAGHTFMYVAGLRFDTVALADTGSRWSGRSATEPDLSSFTVRHPPGL